jgi:hypothetical protein
VHKEVAINPMRTEFAKKLVNEPVISAAKKSRNEAPIEDKNETPTQDI